MLNALASLGFKISSRVASVASRVSVYADFAASCRREDVRSVLDIGANRGQFASRLRRAGWRGATYSFEPMRELHQRLVATAAKDPRWTIADCVALGETAGLSALNVASNDGKSSSLLAADRQSGLYDSAFRFVRTESVRVVSLDSWMESVDPEAPFAIKIDVQGFELKVLRGARATLSRTRLVMLEAPLAPSYVGSATFDELYRFMFENGFQLSNARASTLSPSDGRPVELDVEFTSIRA